MHAIAILRRARAAALAIAATLSLCAPTSLLPAAAHAEALAGGSYVLVTTADDRLAAIDRADNRVVSTVQVPGLSEAPHPDVVVDSANGVVYLPTGPSITVVDATSLTVVETLADPAGSDFISVAVSPDGQRLYGLTADGHVTVFAPDSTGVTGVLQRVPTSGAPMHTMARELAATNSGVYAAAAGTTVNYLARDDAAVSVSIDLEAPPAALTIDSDSGVLFVVRDAGPTDIAAVSLSSHQILGYPPVNQPGFHPIALQPISLTPNRTTLVMVCADPTMFQLMWASFPDSSAEIGALPGAGGVAAAAPDNVSFWVPMTGTTTVAGLINGDWRDPVMVTLTANVLAVGIVEVDPPGAPTDVVLSGGDGRVTVGFSPGKAGPSPTTRYRVSATDLTDPSRPVPPVVSAASPVTVTGLTNGHTYVFGVTALSAAGNSLPAESGRLAVGIVPSFTGTTAPEPATVGEPYTFTFTTAGAPAPTVTKAPGIPLPAGLSYDAATATISGTPTETGTAYVVFTAANALGSVSIAPALVVGEALADPEPSPAPSPAPAQPTKPGAGTPKAGASAAGAKAKAPKTSTQRPLAKTGVDPLIPLGIAVFALWVGGTLVGTRLLTSRRNRCRDHRPSDV